MKARFLSIIMAAVLLSVPPSASAQGSSEFISRDPDLSPGFSSTFLQEDSALEKKNGSEEDDALRAGQLASLQGGQGHERHDKKHDRNIHKKRGGHSEDHLLGRNRKR